MASNKATNKTVPTTLSVEEFIANISDERRREETRVLRELMERVSGEPATMWGATMVGFGSYHYVYASGREGDIFVVGFSPRKAALSLYGLLCSQNNDLLGQLGSYTTGKGCLWVKHLSDIDLTVCEQMVTRAVASGG